MKRRDFIKLTMAGVSCPTLAMLSSWEIQAAMPADKHSFRPGAAKGHDYVDLNGAEALIAGYPVSWWRNNYGLPLHIHYAPAIQDNVRAFQGVFKKHYPKGEIRFAAKANPHPSIFRIVLQEGEGVDVASEYECQGALLAHADPKCLDVNGNAKSDNFIRLAISKDMLIISDSAEEFLMIGQLAKEMNRIPRVMQRLSGFSLGQATQASTFTAGVWTKFGMNIKDIGEFYPLLDKYPEIDFQGFHVHIGSPIATLEPYQIVAGKMVEYSKLLIERGHSCKILNIGGGFPVNYQNKSQWDEILQKIKNGYKAYNAGDPSKLWVWENMPSGYQDEQTGIIDLNNWSGVKFYSEFPKEKMVQDLLTGDITVNGKKISFLNAFKEIGNPTLVIEPGRSLAEDSGVTLSQVGQIKKVDGVHDLVALEAGVVNFGDALEHTLPMNRWDLVTGRDKKDPKPFNAFLAGHLCFTGDMPSKYKVSMARKPVRGDVLMTHDTGAYNPHFYAANTNAFPRPARVLVQENGSVEFIKTRDTLDEIYSLKG